MLLIGSCGRKCIHGLALIGNTFTTKFFGIANLGTPRQVSIDATKIVATGTTTLYITCLCTDCSFVVWHSVIQANELGEIQKMATVLKRRRIIEMDISANLGIAAIITEAPALVLRRLWNGQTYRKAKLDALASHVKITQQGLVVVLSRGRFPEGIHCRTDVFDLNCRRLYSKSFPKKMRLWDVAALDAVDDLTVVCFAHNMLMMLRAFGLVHVSSCELESKPFAMVVGDGRIVFLLFSRGGIASVRVKL
jgi:hypothetical protein